MIRHIAINFNASIPLTEIQDALAARGIHLREVGGRLVADRVPGFLRNIASKEDAKRVKLATDRFKRMVA